MIQIRQALQLEIDWVNTCYEEVDFRPSSFDKEIIAIAEYKGQKAGLGRLVSFDSNTLELGGMYVFKAFRKKGIAGKIVEFLMKFSSKQNIYCIPFEPLIPFYAEFGFINCRNHEEAPYSILQKYLWCQEKYPTQVSLLIFKKAT